MTGSHANSATRAIGLEALFLRNGEWFVGHRFDTRALATQWAETMRAVIEKGGPP